MILKKMDLMQNRGFNFGAGPAMLAESVLQSAQAELLNWQGSGMSILEVGHRTEAFQALMANLESLFRRVLSIPDHYRLLFLTSPARLQFAQIPMNLLKPGIKANYLVTGLWSKMAYQEACHLQAGHLAFSSEHDNSFGSIPVNPTFDLRPEGYLYLTPNETVQGIRWPYLPVAEGLPLVADMTSCLLTEPVNIEDYGLLFAGFQKNIANAGMTLVIIREDLLALEGQPLLPTMLSYRLAAEHRSLYATPAVFNCYLAEKTLEWMLAQGGLPYFYQLNCKKAKALYEFIDQSEFYNNDIDPACRSLVNIVFHLKDSRLEKQFIEEAQAEQLYALQGHRTVGGLRASLYNAMPLAGVERLIEFMRFFAEENQS